MPREIVIYYTDTRFQHDVNTEVACISVRHGSICARYTISDGDCINEPESDEPFKIGCCKASDGESQTMVREDNSPRLEHAQTH